MDTPLKSRSRARRETAILGSATIPGRPEEVSGARAFVARTLSAADKTPPLDSDAATLLTSELVTNAIQHTASGGPGGTVTIVVVDVPDGVLVEVIDDGSDGTPVVKRDVLTTNGHGLLPGAAARRAVGLPAGSGGHHGLVPPVVRLVARRRLASALASPP